VEEKTGTFYFFSDGFQLSGPSQWAQTRFKSQGHRGSSPTQTGEQMECLKKGLKGEQVPGVFSTLCDPSNMAEMNNGDGCEKDS